MNPNKDRRSEDYNFHSLMALFEYFSNSLSSEEMDNVVRESSQGFSPRQFESEEITRLQFLKKCEYGMDTLAQLKEVGVYTGLKDFKREEGKRE